jgi:hypothetical protein
MGDLQESRISEFSERSFFGTPSLNAHIIVETPGIRIPDIITFISEQVITVDTTDTSPQGSVHSELTSEPVPPPVKTPDPSPVQMPVQLSSPCPTPSDTFVNMTINDVTINGLTSKVSTVQKAVVSQRVLHNLDKKERNDINVRATVNHRKLFDLISLVITSEDKLDDTYNLEMLIDYMISSHGDYEMSDVFKIISWKQILFLANFRSMEDPRTCIMITQISMLRLWLNQMRHTVHM